MKRKTSILWTIQKEELEKIVKTSDSYKDVLVNLGFAIKSGGNYKTLKQRLEQDDIDVSHIEAAKRTFRGTSKEIPLEKMLTTNSKHSTKTLKKKLFKEGLLENQCLKCGLSETWQGEPISLQLDHINGNHDDNRIENLRMLCPNCHSQTQTYGGRNSKGKWNKSWICKCGEQKHRQSKTCYRCRIRPEKTNWPRDEELIQKAKTQSILSIGKELGVSDNAIRKRLRKIQSG